MNLLLATWIILAPIVTPRQEIAVAAVGDKVYAIGGLSGDAVLATVEEYNTETNQWRFVANLPQPVHHPAAAVSGGFVYVIGGYRSISFTPTAAVHRYDPARDQWSPVASLPRPAGALAAAAIDGKIYAVGGSPTVRDLLVYDPVTDRWTQLASMPTPREHLSAASFGGRLYVAAGRAGPNTNAFESYDPASDTWTRLSPVPTGRSGLAASILHGRMYVLGGEGNSATPTGVFEENESYDFASGTWRRELPMRTPRHGIGAATVGGRILIPAGATVAGFGTTAVNEAFEDTPGKRRRAVTK